MPQKGGIQDKPSGVTHPQHSRLCHCRQQVHHWKNFINHTKCSNLTKHQIRHFQIFQHSTHLHLEVTPPAKITWLTALRRKRTERWRRICWCWLLIAHCKSYNHFNTIKTYWRVWCQYTFEPTDTTPTCARATDTLEDHQLPCSWGQFAAVERPKIWFGV